MGNGLELNAAACRQERESELHLAFDVGTRSTDQCTEAPIESELLPMIADKIEHRADLPFCLAQATAELLHEEERAVGRPEEKQSVNVANIDTFVEEIYGEDRLDCSVPQPVEGSTACVRRAVRGDRDRVNSGIENCCAMNRAWSTLTQKPSERIARGSATYCRAFSITRRAHTWSAVRTFVSAVTS